MDYSLICFNIELIPARSYILLIGSPLFFHKLYVINNNIELYYIYYLPKIGLFQPLILILFVY